MSKKEILGIDIGGSGIKGAIIDIKTGNLLSDRLKYATPKPSSPKAVAKVFNQLVADFKWNDVIGCGFPAIIRNGVAHSAANVDKKWIGTPVEKLLSEATSLPVFVRNDADLAGLAEMNYGEGRNVKGTVLLITIGSGLGSALFINGELVPNTEFGHLYLKKMEVIAEQYAADSVRKKLDLSWPEWGDRLNQYLLHIEHLFSPDLIILGGGSSKKIDRYSKQLTIKTKVVPAQLRNNAGIIGAAIYAHKKKSLTNQSKTFQSL